MKKKWLERYQTILLFTLGCMAFGYATLGLAGVIWLGGGAVVGYWAAVIEGGDE